MKKRLVFIFLILTLFLSACMPLENINLPLAENVVSIDEGTLKIHFIDVGQGDCTFIQSENTTMLIDAGTSESGNAICTYLENIGITEIDYFIGTHPHEDHLGGAAAVIMNFDIGSVFMTEQRSSSFFFEKMLDALIRRNLSVNIPKTGCIYKADGFDFEFLCPETDFGNLNDNSIVLRLDFGKTSMLFTADAEKSTEKYLLENNKNVKADILKVGHHGSRYASTTEFLNAVKPSVAVISCGEGNSYGHPHSEAVARLEKAGAKIFRTDENKNIILISDGEKIFSENGEVFEENNTETKVVYIGNKKSGKFHSDACRNLPSEKNSALFFSREEALLRGYQPCGSCEP